MRSRAARLCRQEVHDGLSRCPASREVEIAWEHLTPRHHGHLDQWVSHAFELGQPIRRYVVIIDLDQVSRSMREAEVEVEL